MRLQFVPELPALTRLLEQHAIKLVDVGGRGSAMPQLLALAPVAHYYSCEPDPTEAAQLRERLPQEAPWRSVTVMGEALASQPGEAQLHLTKKSGMSSLLQPDAEVVGRYYEGHGFDIISTTTVPTLTLAAAAARYGFDDASFIKLDTQGTELDILRSGEALLDRAVVGVYVEAGFQPLYAGQPLFADVDTFLRGKGFSLVGLYRTMMRRSGFRTDRYSRRVAVWAHCLYFREPLSVVAGDPARAARDAARLLGLTLAFRYFDLSFEILRLASERELFADSQQLASELEGAVERDTRRVLDKTRRAQASDDGTAAVLARHVRDNRYFD